MLDYLPILIVLLVLAAFIHEDAVLTILYLLGGIYLAGTWWSRAALHSVRFRRTFPARAFISEVIPVHVHLTNTNLLPVAWLQIRESLPVELGATNAYRGAFSLPSKGKADFQYKLYALKRGYYSIGPLYMRSGDLLGLGPDKEITGSPDPLIVYPRIIPFVRVKLPSRTPFGSIRHTQPLFEDPSRILGKREYQSGDSLRHIDWKSSASAGSLQVKQYGPSISLETAVFLNLDSEDYDLRSRLDDTEMAIVVAASLANWVCGQKQSVGLYTNGLDPLEAHQIANPLQPHKGRGHLMRTLDLLARVQVSNRTNFPGILRQQYPRLTWGTTLILITGQAPDAIFDAMFQARRYGLNPMLILMGPNHETRQIQLKAERFGVPFHSVRYDADLDSWCR
jgi:uncharacterized protein (DUF58 family)